MARTFHVYPKAQLVDSTWKLVVKVYEPSTKENWRFVHEITAGVVASTALFELKISFDLIVADTDTPQDVDDALFVDDIAPGPSVASVWARWQDRAENIISGLSAPYTLSNYWADWAPNNTAKTRTDARKALMTQRGWSVPFIHWHEGDGTSEDGVG